MSVARQEPAARDGRLDVAKALAASLVLFWHLQPLQLHKASGHPAALSAAEFVLTTVNHQVCLLAVPLFLLVSLHLFNNKIEARPLEATIKRCRRLGTVYLFWTACQFSALWAIAAARRLNTKEGDFSTVLPIHRLLMEGGPPLPIVGGSVFYFLFALLVLVVLAAAYHSLRGADLLQQSVGFAVVAVSIISFESLNLRGKGLEYWRVDNFLIYVPVSYVLSKLSARGIRRCGYLFSAGFILFSCQDVYLRHLDYRAGAYSRVSIVCGAIAVFCAMLQLNRRAGGPIVSFLSTYALGIFATHKYWQLFVSIGFVALGSTSPVATAGLPLDLRALAIALATVFLTIAALAVCRNTSIRKFIA